MEKVSFLKRIKNFSVSLKDIILDGFDRVSPRRKKKRLDICNSCKFKTIEKGFDTCGICGCVLSVKSHFKSSNCPKGFWEEQEV